VKKNRPSRRQVRKGVGKLRHSVSTVVAEIRNVRRQPKQVVHLEKIGIVVGQARKAGEKGVDEVGGKM